MDIMGSIGGNFNQVLSDEYSARQRLRKYKERRIFATDEQFLKLQIYLDRLKQESDNPTNQSNKQG